MKLSNPIDREMLKPIADHREYLPPTQSQKPNILFVSMPNSDTFAALVLRATKCLATAAGYKKKKKKYYFYKKEIKPNLKLSLQTGIYILIGNLIFLSYMKFFHELLK